MTRRRLSKQQRARIRQRQQRQLDQSNATIGVVSGSEPESRYAGLVTCNFGQQLEVEVLEGPLLGQSIRCFQRSNLDPLVCGDRVVIAVDEEDSGVILGQQERRNEFSRPNPGGELKPVAANINVVMVVLAARPQPFLNLLDRYLVAIENLGLKALIVVNKADLLHLESDSVIDTVRDLYPRLGYSVQLVSAQDGSGLQALAKRLAGQTAVIVGQSGVGKSSLLNALGTDLQIEVGALSEGTDKGTHTTTTARLFHLDGFDLIDSPGIREFNLWHVSQQKLLEGFVEFRPHLGHCKFRDCRHRDEPGCALRSAVDSGQISELRLASYFHIQGSL